MLDIVYDRLVYIDATGKPQPWIAESWTVDDQGKVGLYRLEVGCSPGTGKLKIAGGIEGPMKESIQRAFAYLQGQKAKMGVGQQIDRVMLRAVSR